MKTPVLLANALVGIELAEINAPARGRLSELAALSDNAINGDIHNLEKLSRLSASDLATDRPREKSPFLDDWVPEVFEKQL